MIEERELIPRGRFAMRVLILARHGEYDKRTEDLNDWGQQQIVALAGKLKSLISGSSLVILSSASPRARQSGEIFAREFGVDVPAAHMALSALRECGGYTPDAAFEIIKANSQCDVLLVVTDWEFIDKFPPFFAEHTNLDGPLPGQYVDKGEALVIDLISASMLRIRNKN